ncbi:type II toxin-antitoxin system PemK/MazF family toxin [Leifsonia sp. ku-ls]|nr:type II toxin-antitoxin system PemK/MazF family toxin [Leifsonia sp. ku-ls]
MRRGTVLYAQFDPAFPGEAAKSRPCIVVSQIGANRAAMGGGRGTLVVVPLTSKTAYVHPDGQVLIDDEDAMIQMGLRVASKAQPEQMRAISVDRVHRELGVTPSWLMWQVDEALRFHLSL